jgi:F-type H+-transporting ATPase subunit gamma
MEDVERAETRLDNIRTVEPILGALRTISLGSWKAALKQTDGVRQYAERLRAMLPLLAPHLPAGGRSRRVARRAGHEHEPTPEQIAVLVVGSERGLCGRFNMAVTERAKRYIAEKEAAGATVEIMALGTQTLRILRRGGRSPAWSGTSSIAALPPYSVALYLTRRWLARYEEHELDAVDLVYNAYRGTARYKPTSTRLIPPRFPPQTGAAAGEAWPPPIVETDPVSLYTRIVEQWAATSLYGLLLDSAAAEHSTRFQLMEAASQNADRLIMELTLAVQTARQQEITQEMQELAAGAGLIGPQQKDN